MKLILIDTNGEMLHGVDCFVNESGWLEDVTRSATFDVECEIALGNYNEGGLKSGTITDSDDNIECYWVIA